MPQMLKVVVFMVALMSGVLSIIREAIDLFFPNRFSHTSVFWRCVWVSFIISMMFLLYDEHRKVVDLTSQLNSSVPVLSGTIYYVYAFPLPDQNATKVFIASTIVNDG